MNLISDEFEKLKAEAGPVLRARLDEGSFGAVAKLFFAMGAAGVLKEVLERLKELDDAGTEALIEEVFAEFIRIRQEYRDDAR